MICRTLTFESLKYSLCTISPGNECYNVVSFDTGKKSKNRNIRSGERSLLRQVQLQVRHEPQTLHRFQRALLQNNLWIWVHPCESHLHTCFQGSCRWTIWQVHCRSRSWHVLGEQQIQQQNKEMQGLTTQKRLSCAREPCRTL
jgi:hypothetical protein